MPKKKPAKRDRRLLLRKAIQDRETAIEAGIGWTPQDGGSIDYSIADGGGGTYEVTAVDEVGTTICVQFPGGDRC